MSSVKPLLVGESNPYGSDPRFALYPDPPNSAGGRLCRKVLQLTESAYLAHFDRANLCRREWDLGEARTSAAYLVATHPVIVLLGARVTRAFGYEFKPFTYYSIVATGQPRETTVILPHPSGLSRAWNAPDSFTRAHQILCKAGVLPVNGGSS